MRAQLLPSGNYRICLSDGFDEDGKRVYKSFTADAEWKVIKLAEDYKKLKKKSGEKNKCKRKVQEPDDHKDVKNFTLQKQTKRMKLSPFLGEQQSNRFVTFKVT